MSAIKPASGPAVEPRSSQKLREVEPDPRKERQQAEAKEAAAEDAEQKSAERKAALAEA